jgi:post-segregation antitoxin (ccd killing protein)
VVEKKRRIAKKPTASPPPAADDWVSGGGQDPEIPPLDVQTSKHSDVQTSKAKSSSPGYKRTTVYLTNDLHRRLKVAGLNLNMEMSDIAEKAIAQWLEQHTDA